MKLATHAFTVCLCVTVVLSCPQPSQVVIPQWNPFQRVQIQTDRNLHKVWYPRPQAQQQKPTDQARPGVKAETGVRDCGQQCPCPYDFRPLCGTNGITYDNPCQMECQQNCYPGLRMYKVGPCDE